jgi:hypothetical protein
VLVFEDKDKAVYYNGWAPIVAGGLEFAVSLHDFAQIDYGQIEVSQGLQDKADAILSTMAVVTPPAGAVEPTPAAPASPPATELTSYTNDDFGFTFQYPADWALEVIPRRPLEGASPGGPQWLADAIELSKGKPAISIQYMHTSEESPVAWDGRFSGGGLPQEANKETVDLIGQEAPKWVWTDEDGIKAMMVQTVREDADLVLTIELRDGTVNGIFDPLAETLPETAISVLDGILSSFALTQ